MNLLLIGGLPSSGSTFLIYHLSKRSHFLCLPETGLFTQGRSFCSRSEELSDSLHTKVPWINVKTKAYQAIGWDISLGEHDKLLSSPIEILKNHLEVLPEGYIVVEKTPENIFAFDHYLKNDTTRKVLITLRDLESVCFSLMKRKFSMLEAILIWFAHAFEAFRLLQRYPTQILPIYYEELCRTPEDYVSRILDFFEKQDISKPRATLDANGLLQKDQYQWALKQLSWGLSGRYWSKEISALPDPKIAKWRLGVEFDALLDSIAFKTQEGDPIKPRWLDSALQEKSFTLKSVFSGECRPVSMVCNTLLIESLMKYYPIHLHVPLNNDGQLAFLVPNCDKAA